MSAPPVPLPADVVEALTGMAASNREIARAQASLATAASDARLDRHADRVVAARTLTAEGSRLQSRIAKVSFGAALSVADAMSLAADVALALARFTTPDERKAHLVELVGADSDALRRGSVIAAWPLDDFVSVGSNVFEANCTMAFWRLLRLPTVVLNCVPVPHDKESLGSWVARAQIFRWRHVFVATCRDDVRASADAMFWFHCSGVMLLHLPVDHVAEPARVVISALSSADGLTSLLDRYSSLTFVKGRVSLLVSSAVAGCGLATTVVRVGGATGPDVLALVDSCANRTLVSARLASTFGRALPGAESVLVANGDRSAPLAAVELLVGGVLVSALVVPDSAGVDLLLGVPALQLLGGARIDVGVDRVQVKLAAPAGRAADVPAGSVSSPAEVDPAAPAVAPDSPAEVNLAVPAVAPDCVVLLAQAVPTGADELVLFLPLGDGIGFSVELSGTDLLRGRSLSVAAIDATVAAAEALDAELAGGDAAACFHLAGADSADADVDAFPLALAPPSDGMPPTAPAAPAAFPLARAVDALLLQVDAHPLLSAEQKTRLKAGVLASGVDGHSKLAPPVHGRPPIVGVVHRIVLRRGASLRGVRASHRARSPIKAAALREQLAAWRAAGFVEPTQPNTGFCLSAPVVVPKPDGGWRVAVDFRALNAQSESDPFPPPPMADVAALASGGHFVSTFDGLHLFNQIELDEASRPLTATLFGPGAVFQFTRSPFGLNSILGTAQRHMTKLFHVDGVRSVYVDDVVQQHASASLDDAIDEVIDVLSICARNNLLLNFDKVKMIETSITLFGYTVGRGTCTPAAPRCRAITDWPTPTNNAELRQMLQTAQYYAAFIPGWTAITVPLWDAIKRSRPLVLGALELGSLARLRAGFAHAAVAATFDPQRRVEVCTDACDYAISATVGQRDDSGVLRFLATAGRRLLPSEMRHPIDVKEVLAIGFALVRFQEYLDGTVQPWLWLTDCAAISNAKTADLAPKSIAARRVLLQLAPHSFDVRAIRSKDNLFCDAIGRLHLRDADAAAFMLRSGARYLRSDGVYARARPLATVDDGFLSATDSSDESEPLPEPPGADDVALTPVDSAPLPEPPGASVAVAGVRTEAPEPLVTPPPSPSSVPAGVDALDDGKSATADEKPVADDTPAGVGALDDVEPVPPSATHDDNPVAEPAPSTGALLLDALVGLPDDRAVPAGHDLDAEHHRWCTAQVGDKLGRVLRQIAAGGTGPAFARQLKPSIDTTGRVFVQAGGRVRLFVPAALTSDVMGAAHNGVSGGHRSAAQLVEQLSLHFYWPQMIESATAFVARCAVCARMAPARPLTNLGMKDAAHKLRVVHADIVPMPPGDGGMRAILLLRDAFTGHIVLHTMGDRSFSSVRVGIEDHWLLQHGAPAVLIPDGAAELTGKGMAALAKQYGFILRPTAPYNSAQNGTAETAVKMVKRAIVAALGARPITHWPSVVQLAAWQYNVALSAPRGASPYLLMRGIAPPTALLRKVGVETAAPDLSPAEVMADDVEHSAAAETAIERRRAVDQRAVEKRGVAFVPVVGQVVWLDNVTQKTAIERNLHKRDGPFEVASVDPDGRHLCRLKVWQTQMMVPGDVGFRRLTPFEADLAPAPAGPLEATDAVAPVHAPPKFYNERQRVAHARALKQKKKQRLVGARVLATRFDPVVGPIVLLCSSDGQAVARALTFVWRAEFDQFRADHVHRRKVVDVDEEGMSIVVRD